MRKSLIIAFGLALLCPLASMPPALATNYNVPKACRPTTETVSMMYRTSRFVWTI